VAEAKIKLAKVEGLWETFQEVQASIEEIKLQETQDENVVCADQEAEREVFESVYFEFLQFLNDHCRTLEIIDKTRGKQDATKASVPK